MFPIFTGGRTGRCQLASRSRYRLDAAGAVSDRELDLRPGYSRRTSTPGRRRGRRPRRGRRERIVVRMRGRHPVSEDVDPVTCRRTDGKSNATCPPRAAPVLKRTRGHMSMGFRRFATNLSDAGTRLVVNAGNKTSGTCPSPQRSAAVSPVGFGPDARIATVSDEAATAQVSHGRQRR
jgi:hypothetical protein